MNCVKTERGYSMSYMSYGFVVYYCLVWFRIYHAVYTKNLKQSPKYKVKVNPTPQGLASKTITEDYPLCIPASAGNDCQKSEGCIHKKS